MSSLDSTLPQNTTLLHPPNFLIKAFHNVPYAKYYYVFLCFAFVVSVLGNLFVMFIIYTESSLHTPKHMPIFNMAVADLGSATALLPNLAATFLLNSQYISFDACLANMFFVFYFNSNQSFILTVMAYDRLVAICLPLRYHAIITMPAMAVISTVAWAYPALCLIPLVALVTRLSFCKSTVLESYFCDHGPMLLMACNSVHINVYVGLVSEISFVYLPLFLIILSYVFIFVALFKIASWKGRFKAIKTCFPQLMLMALYYLPQISSAFYSVDDVSSSFSFAIRPMLDPIIHMLSTEQVRQFFPKFSREKKNQQLK